MHAYADESGCFTEKYQSIGIVSGTQVELDNIRNELRNMINSTKEVTEIKFSKVRTHRPHINLADAYVKKALDYIGLKKIAIDVICWNISDTRHAIEGRDNEANLGRMYYKILRNISEKWHKSDWSLFPDSGSNINWEEIKAYLNKTRLIPKRESSRLFIESNEFIKYSSIEIKNSIEEPLIQIADLFAGMSCFSIANKEQFHAWHEHYLNRECLLLFDESPLYGIKKTMGNRFELIHNVYIKAKEYGLGVSLMSHGYLKTFKKYSPLNIWHYEAISPHDKAPTRKKNS